MKIKWTKAQAGRYTARINDNNLIIERLHGEWLLSANGWTCDILPTLAQAKAAFQKNLDNNEL